LANAEHEAFFPGVFEQEETRYVCHAEIKIIAMVFYAFDGG
jgi:hypothetical protein